MEIIKEIIERVKEDKKTIVLPETKDIRVLKAAEEILSLGFAKLILIGDKEEILNKCNMEKIDVTGAEIINPLTYDLTNKFVKDLYELRKEKGMTIQLANELMKDEVYFGVMLVKEMVADGLVSGAIHSTADTLRPALQIVKMAEGKKIASSFLLMDMYDSDYKDIYVFSDCGLVENPTGEQLADIAIDTNDSYKMIMKKAPKIALLSYSTYGSAMSDEISKVKIAKEKVNKLRPDIIIDGELQLDAAIDSRVAKLKAPGSEVAGDSDVLIFPDLEAGNIGYKLVERFAKAKAFGPITQGLAKPINDLSRGCKASDIVGVVAITCLQAKTQEY